MCIRDRYRDSMLLQIASKGALFFSREIIFPMRFFSSAELSFGRFRQSTVEYFSNSLLRFPPLCRIVSHWMSQLPAKCARIFRMIFGAPVRVASCETNKTRRCGGACGVLFFFERRKSLIERACFESYSVEEGIWRTVSGAAR